MSRVFTEPGTLIGHRGLGKGTVDGLTQNTLESFLAGVELGLEWIEVDVRRTADEELVVVHNAVLSDGSLVADRTAAELADAGVVRLGTLLEVVPDSVGVVFDVKSSLDDARRDAGSTTAGLLGRWCADHLGDRPVLTQSFDPTALVHVRAGAPGMPVGWLTWLHFPIGLAVATGAHLDVQVLAVHAGSLDSESQQRVGEWTPVEDAVEALHDTGRELMAWCPAAEAVGTLREDGVDAIVVDDVPRVLGARRPPGDPGAGGASQRGR